MEGDLKVLPGELLDAGYDVTMPGGHPAATIDVRSPKLTFVATCASGDPAGTLVVDMPDASLAVAADSPAWLPSGDQHSPLVYQGSLVVPDLCAGGALRLQQGGTFTNQISSTAPASSVHVRWHYRAHGTSGSWSGTCDNGTTSLPTSTVASCKQWPAGPANVVWPADNAVRT
jgi:hypothetical protein